MQRIPVRVATRPGPTIMKPVSRDDARRRLPPTWRLRQDPTVGLGLGPATPASVSAAHAAGTSAAGATSAPGEPVDADLIRATLAGDERAFGVLVDRYQKRAFWVAFHVLGRVEEARDVVQEAFVRVFRSLERFDFDKSFYTWLYRIAMNLAIDALRKIQASRAVEMEDAGEMPAEQPLPSDPVEGEERMRLVREVVSKLPPRFRTVLVLRDLEGLSCREIVPIMRISHATVRWRLHRARQMFREHWLRLTRSWS